VFCELFLRITDVEDEVDVRNTFKMWTSWHGNHLNIFTLRSIMGELRPLLELLKQTCMCV